MAPFHSLRSLFIFVCLLATFSIQAQTKNFASGDIFGNNYLVKNKGQFDHLALHIKKIDAALHQGNTEVYFSADGFQFHTLQQNIVTELKEDEKLEEHENIELIKEDWFALHWIGANQQAQFWPEGKSLHYYSYGDEAMNSFGYKKITYKNVYPGIDIMYEVHPKGGIEYSIFVSTADNLNAVKFNYTAQHEIETDISDDKIIIKNSTGQLVESGIKAFYQNGTPIKIKYQETNGVVQFKPLEKTDQEQSFTIDPWVTAATALTGVTAATHGFDVDYDLGGNLLVMGGGSGSNSITNAPKVAKYDLAGNLLWVFAGYNVAPAWNACMISTQMGNFVVDKYSSKTYISQPYTPNGSRMLRLNPAGNFDNYISQANNQMEEIWEMKFNCNTGKIIACGGGTSSNLNFGLVDTMTGAVSTSNITGQTAIAQDIACAALDINGELYAIFASGIDTFVRDRIYKLNQAYTTSLWSAPSGFHVLQELGNRPNSGFGQFSNGINCLAVNSDYLFYYDGKNLKVFNKATGANVGNSLSNNLQAKYQYGIYANNCNEVYIGRDNGMIHKMFFDGTNFILQDSLSITGYPNGSIYDIVFNPIVNQLMVSGEGFVASLNLQSTCTQSSGGNLLLTYTLYCPDSATVTVTNSNPTDAYTFVWYDSTTLTQLANISLPSGVSIHGLGGLIAGNNINVNAIKASACQFINSDTSFIMNCAADTTLYRITCPGDTIHIGTKIISAPGTYADTFTNVLNFDSLVFTIYTHYPIYNQTANATICQGQTYTLLNNMVVSEPGVYVDTFQTIHGCDSVINTVLKVTPATPTNITVSICATDFYTLPNNTTTNIAGIYADTLSTMAGCDSIIIVDLKVVEQQKLDLGADTIVCPGRPILLNAELLGASSYTWHDFSTEKTYLVKQAGTIYVRVDLSLCQPANDTITITECSCNFFIPNAFTPNSDTKNDIFTPYLKCNLAIKDYQLSIFNRWGQKIFFTTNPENGWDGSLNGEPQPTGSYFYTVLFTNPSTGNKDFYRGDVSLIR